MQEAYQPLWSLDDYQQFLQHPDPIIRNWAARHIEGQYPDRAAESFVGLLTDPDPHLQITACRAISQSDDPRYEPALLAVYPESEGFVRNWLMTTLAQLRSPGLLPQLIAELETAPDQHPSDERRELALKSIIEALGYYPDEVARSALWQFIERYRDNDRLAYAAFVGLLRFADPTALPRLVRRYGRLKVRNTDTWHNATIALAEAVGLDYLTRQVIDMIPGNSDDIIWLLDEWWEQEIDYSAAFGSAFDKMALAGYEDLLPHILAELERVVAERGDDPAAWLAAWQAGERPEGYQWRLLYARELIAALVEQPPPTKTRYREAVALSLALLGQVLTDQNDEAMLESAPNELLRQAILFSILESLRQNVLPDVVEQVVALGPGVVPHLIEVLKENRFWPLPRALEALTQIARQHPGAADEAVAAILDLIDDDQGDTILNTAAEALTAIGPPAIAPAAEGLGLVDFAYDIYVCAALSNIPTDASAVALVGHLIAKGAMDEFEADALAELGHPLAIPYLRDYYNWRDDAQLCTILYTLAVLNNYTGPEFKEWRKVAQEDYRAFQRHLAEEKENKKPG
jgi:HEAT repeat protein